MSNVRRAVVSVAALLLVSIAQAELPPAAYIGWQDAAGEALKVHVHDVTKTDRGEEQNGAGGRIVEVVVRAQVLRVDRSATGLKADDAIVIRYETVVDRKEMIVGPSPIPVLSRGQTTPAWLDKTGDAYAPAARGGSFREFQRPATTTAPAR